MDQPIVTPGVQTSEHAQMKKADTWTTILISVGIAIDILPAVLEDIQTAFPQATWVGTALAAVGIVAKVWNAIGYGKSRAAVKAAASSTTKALSIIILIGIATPAFAQETPRWSLQLGKLTLAPSVSVTPLVISLTEILDKNFKLSAGPNVGAGLDVTWPNKYGAAAHVTQRTTVDGPRALATLFAIVPAFETYHIRPGIAYQFGGGAAPWTDGLMFCLSGASNFGFEE